MTIRIDVLADGSVQETGVTSSTLHSAALADCIVHALARLTFPPNGPATIDLGLTLSETW